MGRSENVHGRVRFNCFVFLLFYSSKTNKQTCELFLKNGLAEFTMSYFTVN